ncbi:MAG: alginate lyase family protein, partial [Nocardioides sp.]
IMDPDWFLDPVTGRRAPDDTLAFRVDHRDESRTGNVKAVWELSRHHHLTVLASAWWLTGDDTYAQVVADQLRSWWSANPFLSGVHWTSGIELGIRLVSWTWVRRLLHEWPKVEELFDSNPDALAQIWWHQCYLAAFPSRGSSANNHAVAEACGRLVAACAFPWFAESAGWRQDASRRLPQVLMTNTFPSGVNRELATDYHRFVTELGLVAITEAEAAGHPVGHGTWNLLTASLDAGAALLDVKGRPPRQGDGDEGRALVLEDPDGDTWRQFLGLGAGLVGALPWWPTADETVAGTVAAALLPAPPVVGSRPVRAPKAFPDAGIYLLRTESDRGPEIWCRCDGGPHGFLAIAAHAHADALSVEVRYDGVEVLVDPGTYCYHGEPEWRRYFRSTLAHNTIEVDGEDQSVSGGPFLWSRHAATEVIRAELTGDDVQTWTAHHTGYSRLDPDLLHERTATLDPAASTLTIVDTVTSRRRHAIKLAFHFGPKVSVAMAGSTANLMWPTATRTETATLHLTPTLSWAVHRGETQSPLGWYSARFGHRVEITTLVGSGDAETTFEMTTRLELPTGADHG